MEAVFIDKHYDLVVECKQGSKKACYELYRLYAKAMLNVSFRIVGSVAEAEDVLQEAFLDAFNKVKDFRQDTTFGLWLKQIVVNRSINLLRKRKLELVEAMPGLGYRTKSPFIRQVRVLFGKCGYVVRYTIRKSDGALVILRIWHAREARR